MRKVNSLKISESCLERAKNKAAWNGKSIRKNLIWMLHEKIKKNKVDRQILKG